MVVELLLSVGDGVGGIADSAHLCPYVGVIGSGDGVGGVAGMAHFCPYVGVIGDKVGGVVGWSHFHPVVVAGKSGGVASHGLGGPVG